MFLYLIDYWIPFPQTEYGGVLNVVAASDEDCIEILKLEYENEGCFDGGHLAELEKAVRDSKKFELSESHKYEEQRIVISFIT